MVNYLKFSSCSKCNMFSPSPKLEFLISSWCFLCMDASPQKVLKYR
jgi:hypothetical protein